MLFFTKIGNSTISKYIENSFNEKQNDFKLKFDTFLINTNEINLVANINDSSKIKIDGKISSLFDLKAEFIYKIDIKCRISARRGRPAALKNVVAKENNVC